MAKPLPSEEDWASWRRVMYEAKQAAIASLTPEQKAEADKERAEYAERYKYKRQWKRNRIRDINRACLEGLRRSEIAKKFNLSVAYLMELERKHGFVVSDRKGERRIYGWITESDLKTLDELAEGMLHKPLRKRDLVLKRIIAAAMADNGDTARWLLGDNLKKSAQLMRGEAKGKVK